MTSSNKAIYAASLDPITNGHLWVIEQGMRLFKDLVVAVGINPAKSGKYFFNEKERVELDKSCVPEQIPVMAIGPLFLVDFAIRENANFLIRGARNISDFVAEANMAEMNRKMAETRGFSLETIILVPPYEVSMISSSFVKSLLGYEGCKKEIEQYVPKQIADALFLKGTSK